MNRALVPTILLLATTVVAQPNTKTPGEAEATIGGKTIAVKYQAASAHGRAVFDGPGALLQPNTVWRAGVGNPTTLYTSAELNLGGLDVPPGQYTLFVLLDPKGWQLIVSKEKGAAAHTYQKERDLGRVPMTAERPGSAVDTMKFSVTRAGSNEGRLSLEWGNAGGSVPFTVK